MGHPTHRSTFAREHLLPAVDAALASVALGMPSGGDCPPGGRREGGCQLTANAMVADPRTSTQVLDFLRGLAHPWDSALPKMPKLAVISVSDSGRVIVHFLRN